MQGIAGILGGKGGGAGSGAPAGAAAKPPGRAQPVRAVPTGKGPLRGWVGGGRVHGGGLCVELVCAWGAAPAAEPQGRRPAAAPAEGAGGQAWAGRAVKPPGGGCRGRRARRAAPAEGRGVGGGRRPPPKAARRAACPAGRGAGYAGSGTGKRTMHRTAGSPGFKKSLHNFTKLSPVFTEDKKLCQVLFTICGYNGCQ